MAITILLSCSSLISAKEIVVQKCILGRNYVAELVGEEISGEERVFYLRSGEAGRYIFGDRASSEGRLKKAMCVGKKNPALIVYGEFGKSNYPSGAVITATARLNFSERSFPDLLYLKSGGILAAIPTNGLGEFGEQKFVIYQKSRRSKNEYTRGANRLPPRRNFEVIELFDK